MNVQTNSTTAQTNTSPHSCLITSAYPSLSVGADKVVPAVDGVAHLKYDYPGKNKTITSLQPNSRINAYPSNLPYEHKRGRYHLFDRIFVISVFLDLILTCPNTYSNL